ncbi:MAG TPA: hypothetical protein VFZ61_07710, partial [Polyangiales bacterium]
VLERERKAAISADVDALSKLQDEKRLAMVALGSDETSDEELGTLRMRAMANVQLIRHMAMCLQGMLAPSGATYTPGGARPSGPMGRSWGRL